MGRHRPARQAGPRPRREDPQPRGGRRPELGHSRLPRLAEAGPGRARVRHRQDPRAHRPVQPARHLDGGRDRRRPHGRHREQQAVRQLQDVG